MDFIVQRCEFRIPSALFCPRILNQQREKKNDCTTCFFSKNVMFFLTILFMCLKISGQDPNSHTNGPDPVFKGLMQIRIQIGPDLVFVQGLLQIRIQMVRFQLVVYGLMQI